MPRRLLPYLFVLLMTGCAVTSGNDTPGDEHVAAADLSCAYFYFLWGTHAEYDQHFEESLEAFEKALICDPEASYVEKKIPVLMVKLGRLEEAVAWLKNYITLHPADTSQHLLLAHLSIQQQDREEAIRLYLEVLEQEPDNEGILLRLGILYSQQEKPEEAEKIFLQLIENNPEAYLAHLYLARLLLMTERLEEAAASYDAALQLNWSPELLFEIIDLHAGQGNFTRALQLYDEILDQDPNNERAQLGRIQSLLSLERDEDALVELREIRSTSEDSVPLDMAIAKILLRLDRIDEARSLLVTLQDGTAAAEANYLLGLIAYQQGESLKAIQYLGKIEPGDNDYAEGIYLQVRIFRKLQDRESALVLLQGAIDNSEGRHPLFYALLSSLYQESDQTDIARDILVAGNAAFPENDLLLYEYARLLERSNRHDEAMELMMEVLELKEDHAEALNFIGYSWADRNINLEKAYDYIMKALSLEPESGYIRDSLGWVQFRLGNLEEAREELLKALELEPEDPHIYEHLGDVFTALEMFDEAREAYSHGLEMFEAADEKARIRQKLDELPAP